MYSNNLETYRQFFFNTWQKYQQKSSFDALESKLIAIIIAHPEYHTFLNEINFNQPLSFTLEENPFFHMSLHLALQEQVTIDRPIGIASLYQQLVVKNRDKHSAQHKMMSCLAKILWEAQEKGKPPDENIYLQELKNLL